MTSKRMRSGSDSTACVSACSPSGAVMTSKPSRRRFISTNLRMSSSSSAMRTRSRSRSWSCLWFKFLQPLSESSSRAGRIDAVEDGATGHKDAPPSSHRPIDGLEVDPSIHLNIGRYPGFLHQVAGGADLRHDVCEEALAPKTRTYRHNQDDL